jgi:hypothetical protein
MKKIKPRSPVAKGNIGPREHYLLLDALILHEKDLANIKAQVCFKTKKAKS